MSFTIKKDKDVVVVDVEGQLIVGNRQELKQKVLDELAELMALIERLPHVEGVIVSAKNEVLVSSGLKDRLVRLAPPTDGE